MTDEMPTKATGELEAIFARLRPVIEANAAEREREQAAAASTAPQGRRVKPKASAAWPETFIKRAHALGLRRYVRELAEIADGDLPVNDLWRTFRREWGRRKTRRESAIVTGDANAGKSVCAFSACLDYGRRGSSWDFVDLGEFSDLLSWADKPRIETLRKVGLLVVDDAGDVVDASTAAFALFKRVINARYRDDRPSILCTVEGSEDSLFAGLGPEIMRRFSLRIKAPSNRHG